MGKQRSRLVHAQKKSPKRKALGPVKYSKIELQCPYCDSEMFLVSASVVFPACKSGYMWVCSRYPYCDTYVSAHRGTDVPTGTPANTKLRRQRILLHRAFDQIWKTKEMVRDEAYTWLASVLGLDVKDCHIGMFDEEQCLKAMEIVQKFKGVVISGQEKNSSNNSGNGKQ